MARPRTLPDFNFKIPPILLQHYPSAIKQIERAIIATQHKEKNWDLRWLSAYNKVMIVLFRTNSILSAGLIKPISPELKEALEWLRHKGKHQWDVKHKAIAAPRSPASKKRITSAVSPSSGTAKAGSQKAGTSRRKVIHVTVPVHSETDTSTESQPQS